MGGLPRTLHLPGRGSRGQSMTYGPCSLHHAALTPPRTHLAHEDLKPLGPQPLLQRAHHVQLCGPAIPGGKLCEACGVGYGMLACSRMGQAMGGG